MSEETPVAEVEAEATPEDEKGKRLSETEWAEVVSLWETGEVTLDGLSKRYRITTRGLSKGLRDRGATKGSKAGEIAKAVTERVAAAAAESAVSSFENLRKPRIEKIKNQYYELRESIQKLVQNELSKAIRDKLPLSSANANLIALDRASRILQMNRDELYVLLDVENSVDEATLPTLNVRAMTEEDERVLQDQAMVDELDVDLAIEEDPLAGPDIVIEGTDEP